METVRPRAAPPKVEPAAFDGFWRAYPKKAGKVTAKKVYDRIIKPKTATTAEELLAGAERYAAERQAAIANIKDESPTFTKSPDKWLAGGHWMDEAPAPKQKWFSV
ncbi:hypothetical protein [Bradyrhizobium sp. LMTR 3]|uniref:hypothetical protein n=1 Tax=Bradyrhizobium sp. LMTR 3 TaxID=189873 RepID=UPI00081075F9|nr:hypothetical protein [Bradyrhizobium sp. LMTR 3]OCK54019.1 hypothetical protein LMTR3_22850 [Bradyrhizobium sp. LMTR 3]